MYNLFVLQSAWVLWEVVFLFSALFSIITAVVFIIFGSAKVRKWSYTSFNGFDNTECSNEKLSTEADSTDELISEIW